MKSVAVVGAGVSGLIACDTLQKLGFEVIIFEQTGSIGGIWDVSGYYGVTLQNSRTEYTIPGFPWPTEPGFYPTGGEVLKYLNAFVAAHRLQVRLKHEVVAAVQSKTDNRWTVTVKSTDEATKGGGVQTMEFDYLMIATGQFSQKKTVEPAFARNKFEGVIVSEQEVRDAEHAFRNKRVVVVGNGKSALDMASFAARIAPEVTHVFRTPRWVIPRRMFGLRYNYLLFPRFSTVMMPCWSHPTFSERFLHLLLAPVITVFWLSLQAVFAIHALSHVRSWSAFQRIKRTLPTRESLRYNLRSALPLDTVDSYFGLVASGLIEPCHGAFQGFTGPNTLQVEVNEGTNPETRTIAADVVVLSLGVGAPPVFPYLQPELRALLEGEADGVQLYHHVFSPRVKNFAVAGYNHGFLHMPSCVLGTMLAAAVWRNELVLPDIDEMEASVRRIQKYKRENIAYEPSRACAINTRFQQYNDAVCNELGLSTWRKWPNVFAEYFVQYGGADYHGIVEEYIESRKQNPHVKLHCKPGFDV